MKIRKKLLRKNVLWKKYFLSQNKQTNKKPQKRDGPNPRTNRENKAIQRKSHPQAYTYTLTKKGKGEKLIYSAPKVHLLNLGWFRCLFRYSTDAGTSSCLWSFNPLLLRLLGDISLSLLCSYSSRCSVFYLDPPLCVGHLRSSVLRSHRRALKEQLLWGLWLTQVGEREGYWCGASLRRRGWHDIAAAWGTPRILLGKLSLDHGSQAVAGCTGSQEGWCG